MPTIRESATGSLVMLWETQRALVESEVLGDGTFEWFSKDKQTGAFGGSDDERLRKAPRAFVERLESAYVR